MPNTRHQRNHRQREEDAHNNNQHVPAAAHPREVTGGHAHLRQNENAEARLQRCCTPGSCRFPDEVVDPEDPYDAVKVACNNEGCTEGSWMHKDCFEDFEQSVLAYLRSCGRARSWSEKQRLQNLWTKKGYDLAFKACDCKCGRGHLRKDLDYIPPPFNENTKKQKRHKKKNDKPMPVVSTTYKSNSQSSQVASHVNGNGNYAAPGTAPPTNRAQQLQQQQGRPSTTATQKGKKMPTSSKSSSLKNDNSQHQLQVLDNQIASNPATTNSPNAPTTTNSHNQFILGALPGNGNHQLRLRTNSVSSTGSAASHSSTGSSSIPSSAGSASPISSSPMSENMFFKNRKSSDASIDSAPTVVNGFRQRLNMSAFASLPRNKQNPYHIHMEDANTMASAFSMSCSLAVPKVYPALAELAAEVGSCDVETRNFVLSNLLNKKMYTTKCVLCKTLLPIFDRLPLIDGTFFLSPQSYDEAAIQVIWEGHLQFLNAACLTCLDGHNDIRCAACKQPWDGRSLVIGSMYTYDIFAAMPCCQKRLTCKCCRRAVVDITKGLNFYSQYSQMAICPYCKANDFHFIRSLAETFLVSENVGGCSGPICL